MAATEILGEGWFGRRERIWLVFGAKIFNYLVHGRIRTQLTGFEGAIKAQL
jgi:hypothetical protein